MAAKQIMKTEAVKTFLEAMTHRDLAALYNPSMEVQVVVAQDGGERIEGDFRGKAWSGFTDGISTWKSWRAPWNAATEPEWTDTIQTWDLARHAEGIGMTGWNWVDRESLWVVMDFDAIVGHADSHAGKLTDQQLKEVKDAAWAIPWVTVRRSTSGNGLHLWVFLDGVPTANHSEHAALARSILGKMSGLTGFDFRSKVDACGGNFWAFHRKMRGTAGLELLKQGETLYDIPSNWTDHIPVIRGTRRKTMPALIERSPVPEIEKLFDDLTSQRTNTNLGEDHLKLIAFLESTNCRHWWDQDRSMLVCHTWDLKQAHAELQMRGLFDTISTGTERGNDINGFCFPIRGGSWSVRRFTPGVQEHSSWSQDGAGWTTTFLNRAPDLATAARTAGGIESPKGGYVFPQAGLAIEAAAQVGVQVNLPAWAQGRKAKLKEHRDGRLIFEVDHDPQADALAGGITGWLPEGKVWSRVFHANLKPPTEVEVGNYDDIIRHLITETGGDCGWVIRTDGQWVEEPLQHVKYGLAGAHGFSPKEVTGIIGSGVFRNWKIVNRPFAPEYPGDRQWNRNAAQFRFHPTENRDSLQYPTWSRVLKHCGAGLDDAIKEDQWCKSNGILCGGDYLKVWVASMFQYPLLPLPYLFFYSAEQNTGKSIFHESLTELVTAGVARADNALTSQQGFNGELANAVLCVVEETDLSKAKYAPNRIKDWVNAKHLPIHTKGLTPYTIPNASHWVQASNDFRACPIFQGDTRITMIHVQPLAPDDLIPKEQLLGMLRKEASDFLAEVLGLEIPPSGDRLNLPVISTGEKINAQRSNQTRLEAFLTEHCHQVDGRTIKFSEFVERFHEWLDSSDVHEWPKRLVGRELPPHYPKGRHQKDNQYHIGNISWSPYHPSDTILPKMVLTSRETLVPSSKVIVQS